MERLLAGLSIIGFLAGPAVASCAYGTSLKPRPEGAVEVNTFGYSGAIGPVSWVRLEPENLLCATGRQQSPISLDDGVFDILSGLDIGIQIADMPAGTTFENLGTTVEVVTQGGSMTLGDMSFELQQFHFHLPSEHLDNGTSVDMEMHMVFEGPDGRIAVIGVFIEVVDDAVQPLPEDAVPPRPNATVSGPNALSKRNDGKLGRRQSATSPLLETVFASVREIAQPGASTTTAPLVMSEVVNLLTASDFQTYSGSLTTPPCSEGVTWLIPSQRLSVQLSSFEAAREVIGFNSRFPQNTPGEPNLLELVGSALSAGSMGVPMVQKTWKIIPIPP